LALLIWQKPNLLLLDEPTNHLDLEMREALTYALQEYCGALVLVAHDRYLLKATVDEFYIVSDHKVTKFAGDLDDYQSWLLSARKKLNDTGDSPKEEIKTVVVAKASPRQIQALEVEIKKLHAEKEQLALLLSDSKIYQPENRLKLEDSLKRSAVIEGKLKVLEEKWFGLQE
jgi:ATP-binding cassette subfamily F protein 3